MTMTSIIESPLIWLATHPVAIVGAVVLMLIGLCLLGLGFRGMK